VVLVRLESRTQRGLAANPFKGKSFAEIDKMLMEKGFKKVGPDAASGKGAYFHPETGRQDTTWIRAAFTGRGLNCRTLMFIECVTA